MRLLKLKKKVNIAAKRKPVPVFDVVYENMRDWGQVKRFLRRDVAGSEIDKLMCAATMAYSAGDREPWEFIIVRDADMKRRIAMASEKPWISDAPVLIVLCANDKIASTGGTGERGMKLYAVQDVAAAGQNILLAATAIGLAASWVGEFKEPELTLLLQTPEWVRPQAIIAVGWPAEAPEENIRHRPDDVVHEGAFGKTRRVLDAWGYGH